MFTSPGPPYATLFADSANIDAFSRLRVSNPTGLFASQCQYDTEPLVYEGGATGTGVAPAQNADTRMVALAATAGTGTSFLQSYEYIPYQPGKSQLVFLTGLLGPGVAGVTKDAGLFSLNNGLFYRQNGVNGLQFIRRTKTSGVVVDNPVNQSAWNLDPLNGHGPSGLTLNPNAVFILVLDAQFLGMGRVRIGFDINGVIVWAHEFLNANVLAVPYVQSLTLPIQLLVTATGSVAGASMFFKCASVSSEGGVEDDKAIFFSTPEQSVTAGMFTRTHILSLRPLTTFNGLPNRTFLRAVSIEILVTGANPVLYELAIGCTFTAPPTWTPVNTTYSSTESTATVGTLNTVGVVLQSGYIASGSSFKGAIDAQMQARTPLTLDRSGAVRANGTLSVIVSGLTGTSATRATVNFAEVR